MVVRLEVAVHAVSTAASRTEALAFMQNGHDVTTTGPRENATAAGALESLQRLLQQSPSTRPRARRAADGRAWEGSWLADVERELRWAEGVVIARCFIMMRYLVVFTNA